LRNMPRCLDALDRHANASGSSARHLAVKPEMMGSLCISAAISGGTDDDELMSFMPL